MRRLVVGASVFLDPHFRVMYDEAETLFLDGHEVTFVSCDGACKACIANPHAGRAQCLACAGLCRWYERRFRGRIRVVGFPRVPRIDQKFNYDSVGQIKGIVYRGVNVGYAAYSEYVTLTRDLLEQITPDKRSYIDFLLGEACCYVDIAERLLDVCKPEGVSVFNGRLLEARPFFELARLRGIPVRVNEVISVSNGQDEMEFRHFVFENCLPQDVDGYASKVRECWSSSIYSEQEKCDIARGFFEARRRGKSAGDAITPGTDGVFVKKQVRGTLPEGFDPKKHNIVIFNSSEDELSSIDRDFESHALYGSQMDGVKAVARILRDNPDYHVYLRVHPNLMNINQPYHLKLYELSKDYPNLTVIRADSTCSTYDLIDAAEKVVVLGSTAGVEAAYKNKPVILIGSALYFKLDIAYKPKTEKELRLLLLSENLSPRPIDDAIRYGYFLKRRADMSIKGRVVDLRVLRKRLYGQYRWVPAWPTIPLWNFLQYSDFTTMIRNAVNIFARNLMPTK